MTAQRVSLTRALLFGAVVATGLGSAFGGNRPGDASPPAAPLVAGQPGKAADERPSDRAAIGKALDAFVAAFQKGDGTAVAALWTAEGEYIGDDGVAYRGRGALEKSYGEFFSKNPDNALEVEVDSVRFPSRDTAVVEGHFKLRMGKKKELVVSRCSFLYVREAGQWRIAIAREWPGDGLSVRDLEWLIGTWQAERNGTAVATKYEWTKNKTFIRCHVSITQDGKTATAMQTIGKMPSTGGLHVWTFEDEGGIGDADITRDGKKWVFSARGSTANGQVITATNLLTPIDADSFLWQAVERTADGESLPDLAPIKVSRVRAQP